MKNLRLVVMKFAGATLLGRDWFQQLRLTGTKSASLSSESFATAKVETLLKEYQSLFKDELGSVQSQKVTLHGDVFNALKGHCAHILKVCHTLI